MEDWIMRGSLHNVSSDKPGKRTVAAVLWVPEAESKSGWRDYIVWRDECEQPRELGFKHG